MEWSETAADHKALKYIIEQLHHGKRIKKRAVFNKLPFIVTIIRTWLEKQKATTADGRQQGFIVIYVDAYNCN